MSHRALTFAVTAALVLAACGGSDNRAASAADPVDVPTQTASATVGAAPNPPPTATPRPEPTATAPPPPPSPQPTPRPTPMPSPTPTPGSTLPTVPAPDCWVLHDFDLEAAASTWRVVLDGVMGGLSNGQAVVQDGAMTLTGSINTNGGGFVMVRTPVDPRSIDGANSLRITARPDGRTYEVIVDDTLAGRNRSVSHFAPIPFNSEDEVGGSQVGVVAFADLESRSFGNPVTTEAFRPDLASSIGVILSDGIDGEFAITIDRIEACAAPTG